MNLRLDHLLSKENPNPLIGWDTVNASLSFSAIEEMLDRQKADKSHRFCIEDSVKQVIREDGRHG